MRRSRKLLTEKTKAVIVNTPNNPTGVVYSAETLRNLAEILEKKQKEYRDGSIYLISDEPYRELVYGGVEVPWIPDFYWNTIVGYSFSKSLSLPGERIGYLVLPTEMDDSEAIENRGQCSHQNPGLCQCAILLPESRGPVPGRESRYRLL